MLQRSILLCLLVTLSHRSDRAEALIVADEFPAMQVVAAKLKTEENIESKLVWQTNLPPNLAAFQAVIVYIHKDLSQKAEDAFIEYANGGGRLVVLHHSISSGKRKNQRWFPFLGISLPEKPLSEGGYKWIDPATWELANLNPKHFIMEHKVDFPDRIAYVSTNAPSIEATMPGFVLRESEVYLNHDLIGSRTLLMGLKYTDPGTGITYMQDCAGWTKPAGRGSIVYLMPGHTQQDFENRAYGRIVVNAVIFKSKLTF